MLGIVPEATHAPINTPISRNMTSGTEILESPAEISASIRSQRVPVSTAKIDDTNADSSSVSAVLR